MHDPLWFFLHLPRTAGTTLNAILRDNFAPQEILSVYRAEDYRAARHLEPRQLDSVRLIQGHLFLQSYRPPRMYDRDVRVFTFLRDPVSRLISEYRFLKTWRANHMYTFLNDNRINFREYLLSGHQRLVYRGKNFMTRFFSGEGLPVERFPRRELEMAKHNLEHEFTVVGIQERFDESLLILADAMGLTSLYHERHNALVPVSQGEIGDPAVTGGAEDGAKPGAATIPVAMSGTDSAEVGPAPHGAGDGADLPVSDEDRALAMELNAADHELYCFACELFSTRVERQGASFPRRVRDFVRINTRYQRMCDLISASGQPPAEGIVLPK